MRLLLSSILVGLILTTGCSKSGDNAATGESTIDKTKSDINSTTDKTGEMTQERAEALKALDAMHEAAIAGDKVQDTADDAMKDLNN